MPATALVRGGFWPENGVNTLTLAGEASYARRGVARVLSTKGQAATRERMFKLLGAAPGVQADLVRTYVSNSEELGGKRIIAQDVLIYRPTTAADDTEITADYLTYSTRTHYKNPPVNLDRNPLGDR
jgi:hypothetical protein